MASSAPAIRLDGLTKHYGGALAVDRVSFDINPGEFISMLGPSGCGKTTTLRMIAGFILPSAGTIYVHGTDMTYLPPEKRNLGFVFQNYALWPHMTVFENIAFGLKLRKQPRPRIRKRIDEVLAATGLTGYEERFPRQLSGGQQQRVSLARALALDPQLLLMDEPLSNLDRALRVSMRREIKLLQRRLDMTTLYVTHDQEEALSLSDRVVLMSQGKVERIASPREIYEDPRSEFIADFVGNTNYFDGVIDEITDERTAVSCGSAIRFLLSGDTGRACGDRVRVLLRPERIRMFAQPQTGENTLKAEIDLIEYFGPTIRYTVTLASGESLYIEAHNISQNFVVGDTTWLVIQPENFRLLDPAGA